MEGSLLTRNNTFDMRVCLKASTNCHFRRVLI